MHCLAVAPTVVLSVMFAVLYLVDQVHNLAEQLYLFVQTLFNLSGLVLAILDTNPAGAFYGLFYCHLLIALLIDQYYVYKERGCVLLGDNGF